MSHSRLLDFTARRIRRKRLPCAKPVNIEMEGRGETNTGVQRRHGDSASPILHVIFAHTQPLRCACRTDAGACQCPVEACGQGARQAVIADTALEMTDTLSMSIHLSNFSQIIFFAIQHRFFRCRPNPSICHDGLMTPCCLFAGAPGCHCGWRYSCKNNYSFACAVAPTNKYMFTLAVAHIRQKGRPDHPDEHNPDLRLAPPWGNCIRQQALPRRPGARSRSRHHSLEHLQSLAKVPRARTASADRHRKAARVRRPHCLQSWRP
ncbi:hypothetical protein OKW42_006521 [Paraburkholderia sp. WC7.3d]